ncbi:MAG: BlaI/MecI/CopY family transcriptional regulator [Acidobacteria bacterium]|nr:BlaI/MecI/CopY family transcriptional regulator [Acidobacteriota bacterium]
MEGRLYIRTELDVLLGPLESRVLDELWARGGSTTVRDLLPGFPGVAYTTLMTTADRLFRKGLLTREKRGRAFAYSPRWSRDELHARRAGSALATLLPGGSGALRPIISMFVDEVNRRDASLLDELEALIRLKKEGE